MYLIGGVQVVVASSLLAPYPTRSEDDHGQRCRQRRGQAHKRLKALLLNALWERSEMMACALSVLYNL